MRRHPNHLLRNLLITTVIIIAAMNQHATRQLAELASGLVLAIVQGIADGVVAHPGAAALLAGAVYVAHQIRTHQPRTARARH
jgi:hypothetical protein